jgi:DNA-damage-inducible protein J
MAHAVNVNFRLDEDVKKSMEQVCSELGLSMNPFYSESNIRYLEQKMADYKAGRIKVAEHELIEE